MSEIPFENWQPVIGLEIHVQLNTRTKLFSSTLNEFGHEPNLNIGIVDTGQPGALPVLNKEAVKKAVMFGCAIHAEISHYSRFDRKSYFYPDSPRNYQITQFDYPLLIGGQVTADVEGTDKTFTIHHAHLEDDAGMLKHFSTFAGVDYNRAGVPLLEIVSDPCMHSPKDASAYALTIRSIMQYIGASNCNMEEGSLRVDVNVSVRPKGEKQFRNKIEIKNLNSFSNMELAIESEIRRQIRLYTAEPYKDPKEVIQSGTYRFDLEKKETIPMRSKEEADDYRYFPEPDIPPLVLSEKWIEEIRRNLPELPQQRKTRYLETLKLSEYATNLLITDKKLADYFEEGLAYCDNPRALCNWVTVEFVGRLKNTGKSLPSMQLPAKHVATLVNLLENGTITGPMAKEIADMMVEHPAKDPAEIVEENPKFKPMSDLSEITPLIDQVLKENSQSILDYKNGKDKAFNFLFGQVMKLTKGKANPKIVRDLLSEKIKEF